MLRKTEELGRAMGASHVWRANERPGSPGGTIKGALAWAAMQNRRL
jgi:hypothetical protein